MLSIGFFALGLAIIDGIAFISCAEQAIGLFGNNGILPSITYFSMILTAHSQDHDGRIGSREPTGVPRHNFEKLTEGIGFHLFRQYPTIFWYIPTSDVCIYVVCFAGLLSAAVVFFAQLLGLHLLAWLFILLCEILLISITIVGQDFWEMQMDFHLIEANFIYLITLPFVSVNPLTFLLIMQFFVFRLYLGCGLCKWFSSCSSWRKLTALNYYYNIQPLPTPLASWMRRLPPWFHHSCTLFVLVIELGLPFCIFIPSLFYRSLLFLGCIFHQLVISSTSNFAFLTLLTFVSCIPLLSQNQFCWMLRFIPIFDIFKSECIADHTSYQPEISPFFLLDIIRIPFRMLMYILSWVIVFAYVTLSCRALFESLPHDDVFSLWSSIYSLWNPSVSKIITSYRRTNIRPRTNRSSSNSGIMDNSHSVITSTSTTTVSTTTTSSSTALANSILFYPSSMVRSGYSLISNIYQCFQPFRILNMYAKFAVVMERRWELVIEGSTNKIDWFPFHFKYKVGSPNAKLRFMLPHLPRLDWKVWLLGAQLQYDLMQSRGPIEYPPKDYVYSGYIPIWYRNLLMGILLGNRTTLSLLDDQHLPRFTKLTKRPKSSSSRSIQSENASDIGHKTVSVDEWSPPRYLRTRVFEYEMLNNNDHTNSVWTRKYLFDFGGIVSEKNIVKQSNQKILCYEHNYL